MPSRNDGQKLLLLLHQMRDRKCSRWFLRAVDPVADGVPNYLEIITHPMDLGTIGKKLSQGEYDEDREAFAEDVRLMLKNALTYNPEEANPVNKDANELSRFFESRWSTNKSATANKAAAAVKRKRKDEEVSVTKEAPKPHKPRQKKKKKSFEAETALRLLTHLVAQPHAYHFNEPVDAVGLGIPQYHDIISEPMDFMTIRSKVKAGEYQTDEAFVSDLRLVFHNAVTFNTDPSSEVHRDAIALSKVFESKFFELFGKPPPAEIKISSEEKEEAFTSSLQQQQPTDDKELPWRDKCRRLLEEIAARPEAYYFLAPVDMNSAPGYSTIVHQPMDLGTMAQRLNAYTSADEVVRDAQLIVDNALLYNTSPTHPVREAAVKLRKALKASFVKYGLVPKQSTLEDKLTDLVDQLKSHESAYFFLMPVDPIAMGCPDYLDRIKHPMDIGTLATRVPKYKSAEAFFKDASLIFKNAKTYNTDPSHPVHSQAAVLEQFMKERFNAIFPKNGHIMKREAEERAPVRDIDEHNEASSDKSDEAEWVPSNRPRSDEEKMRRLLDLVLRQPNAASFFGEPVDPIKFGVPDYFEVIDHPMDLGTVRHKLDSGEYGDDRPMEKFIDDVRLVFANARKYNKSTKHIVHHTASTISKVFEKELKALDLAPQVTDTERMDQILTALTSRTDLALFFLEPVDPEKLGLEGYHDIIKKPMDLGTVKTKLKDYKGLETDFADDVRLVFTNAMTYNKNPKLAVHDAAKRLLQLFESKLTAAVRKRDGSQKSLPKKRNIEKVLPSRELTTAPVPSVVEAPKVKHQRNQEPPPSNLKPMSDDDDSIEKEPAVLVSAKSTKRKAEDISMKPALKINRVSKPLPKHEKINEEEPVREKAIIPRRPPPANFFALHPPPLEETPFKVDEIFVFYTPEEIEAKLNSIDLSHLDREFPPEAYEGDIEDMMRPAENVDPRLQKSWNNMLLNMKYEREQQQKLEEKRAEKLRETQRRESERVQEMLHEAELRRLEEEDAEAQRLEEERQQQLEAEKRRAEQREQKRRERAKMQQTVDLDKDRLEVADFLATYGDTDNLGPDESVE